MLCVLSRIALSFAVLQGPSHCGRRVWTAACPPCAYRTYIGGCIVRTSRVAWQWRCVISWTAHHEAYCKDKCICTVYTQHFYYKQKLVMPVALVTQTQACRGDWVSRRSRGSRVCCFSTKWVPQSNTPDKGVPAAATANSTISHQQVSSAMLTPACILVSSLDTILKTPNPRMHVRLASSACHCVQFASTRQHFACLHACLCMVTPSKACSCGILLNDTSYVPVIDFTMPFSTLLPCSCRLGSKIILTKEMNDMQVALHEVFPWRTIWQQRHVRHCNYCWWHAWCSSLHLNTEW